MPLEVRIRQRAHEIYLNRGGADGSELDDWLEAEAELQQEEEDRLMKSAPKRT
jgi:hypothetical protein